MQNGTILKISGGWYVRYWERRNIRGTVEQKRVSHCLGPVTTRGKYPPADVKQLASDHMAKREASKIRPEQVVTLVDFAERIWLPYVERFEKPSTVRSHRNRWTNHLRAESQGLWLREVRCCDVQQILDAIAHSGKLGKNSLKRIKAILLRPSCLPCSAMPDSKATMTGSIPPMMSKFLHRESRSQHTPTHCKRFKLC